MEYYLAMLYGFVVLCIIGILLWVVYRSQLEDDPNPEAFNTQSACHDWPTRRATPLGLTCRGAAGWAAYARPLVPWAYAPYDQVANTGTHPGMRLRA